MNWLNTIRIIVKIVSTLCVCGVFFGGLLWSKHETFANIFVGSGVVAMFYGFTVLMISQFFGI